MQENPYQAPETVSQETDPEPRPKFELDATFFVILFLCLSVTVFFFLLAWVSRPSNS